MRIYWWNLGLHIKPQNQKEADALDLILESLKDLKFSRGPDPFESLSVADGDDE